MNETEFQAFMAECDKECAAMRAELLRLRPQLLKLEEIYTANIDAIPAILFIGSPRLPGGGFATLPAKVEKECEAAVVRVLKRHLRKVKKALGEPA